MKIPFVLFCSLGGKFMVKIILGVIVGFIVWTVIWLGTDAVLTMISPNWYAKNIVDLNTAAASGQPYQSETLMTLMALGLSVICSFISGFTAALIARENVKSTLILGILLLLVGLSVSISFWNYFPLWYHFFFLILLIPVTILGGKVRTQRRSLVG
jgi:hypothetical protein